MRERRILSRSDALRTFEVGDLTTFKREIADLSGIAYGGAGPR